VKGHRKQSKKPAKKTRQVELAEAWGRKLGLYLLVFDGEWSWYCKRTGESLITWNPKTHRYQVRDRSKVGYATMDVACRIALEERDKISGHETDLIGDESAEVSAQFAAMARNAFAGDPEALEWWEANRVKVQP